MTDLESWLSEWRAWCLGEIGPDVPICLSLEHNFIPPQIWETEEPQEDVPADWRGFKVECLVLRMADPERRTIRVHYTTVRQQSENDGQFDERRRRMAQLPAWYYPIVLEKARRELSDRLGLTRNIGGGILRVQEYAC